MSIHVAITREVLAGKEQEFQEALRGFLGESFVHGGVQGAAMITAIPGADNREIGILRSFANEVERDAFFNSSLFRDWEVYASTMTEEPVYRDLTGLEAWFRTPTSPPRWKMAIATLCGVCPTSLFIALTVRHVIKDMPLMLRTLITSGSMVALLTWLVMPQIIKLMKNWLYRAE